MAIIEFSASLSHAAADVFIHLLKIKALITAVVIMNGRVEITSLSKTAGYL
jgi:hypothetical protein